MKIASLVFICVGFFVGPAQAASPVPSHGSDELHAAKDLALLQREISGRMAQIKSEVDLQAYLNSARGLPTPFDLLSPGSKRRFIESLVFTERGLGSFTYSDIRNELSLSEAYRLLALFGREATAASIRGIRVESEEDQLVFQAGAIGSRNLDYMDYWCRTTATCTRKLEDICVAPGC
jgi:hypothetical protein